ncbi:hypothetical protein ABE179_08965 [Aliarcobacter skirrowii]|jgi:hypothetical protein|uniref:hypothetical protein n=1 Tax=Aliarcobacter TaxID=2321111 RepID=UPI0021B3EC79|nr:MULTISPECIES: hypothetical protein [Aliarcobacter]MCT7494001.1 hypothetical protein [Aliarcobacter cryaerophilus]MDX4036134.1 hypothetical protein [Aliarcobacter skirrowii]
MVQKIKNNNLAEYRAFQEEKNKELVLKSIKYIKSLNGIINFSTVSQVTYDIADPLKNEKGLTLAGLSKNKLYRSLIEKAKLSQNIDINLKSNRSFYENSSNSNMTVADIKLQLHELRVKNVNLKMENKILSEQMKTLSSTVSTVEPVSDDMLKKYKFLYQICSNLISRLLELDVAYIDLERTTLNVQIYDDVILQKEALEILYKDKLNELKNGN